MICSVVEPVLHGWKWHKKNYFYYFNASKKFGNFVQQRLVKYRKGKDKKSAIYEAVSSWADQDVSAAASYITSQPPGEGRDTMAGTLARHIGQENPEAGIKWAAMVGDPGTQERAVAGALIDLYRKDEAQARKILQTSSISTQVQQAALVRMTNPGPWWR